MPAEVAYDLNKFAAKTEKEHDQELKSRSLRLIKNRRKVKTVAPVKLIFGVLLVITVASIMIYGQVVLTELTAEANSYQTKLTNLDAEYMRLNGELEASTSIKKLEEAAENQLGLSKIDSSQVEYINLTSSDDIAVAKTGGKYLFEQYWNDIIDFIAEYLQF